MRNFTLLVRTLCKTVSEDLKDKENKNDNCVFFCLLDPFFCQSAKSDWYDEAFSWQIYKLTENLLIFSPNSLYSVSIQLIAQTAPVPPLKQGIKLVLSYPSKPILSLQKFSQHMLSPDYFCHFSK